MSVTTIPDSVRTLFPKEQLEFSSTITSDEAPVLRGVFEKHSCFSQCGEMIEEVSKKNPDLGKRLAHVLSENNKRLSGLSPAAKTFAIQIIHMVTNTLTSLTLGKQIDDTEANRLHQEFKKLPAEDQAALKKNNPDISF
ncbi:unnamed protein product [Caenorhabditis angaria]|uniref:Uncharacterized protein n=1 Tax=Caenorhabditis angaria TaxID=860376 RepID=A0A9P1IBK0_9PELO|nr:unnamed protein product [Caenorhabditis angaria]